MADEPRVRIGFGLGTRTRLSDSTFGVVVDALERLGFDSLWVSERIGAVAPDPLVAMAFAAGRTSRLKFGMSVMVLPGRNPIVLAKELATLSDDEWERVLASAPLRVRLRGTCVGGWMNMEDFIDGYPGCEHGLRATMHEVIGPARAHFFFERLLDYFFTEEDAAYMQALGANVLRLPFNYRHFERDDRPFEYLEEGFRHLDQAVEWCGKHGIYVILDFHARCIPVDIARGDRQVVRQLSLNAHHGLKGVGRLNVTR